MTPAPDMKLKVEILEMKKGGIPGELARFKLRLAVLDQLFGTFPDMRLVEAGGKRFLVPREHTHFRIGGGTERGKKHYVHCYHFNRSVYDAILPYVLQEYSKLEGMGGPGG